MGFLRRRPTPADERREWREQRRASQRFETVMGTRLAREFARAYRVAAAGYLRDGDIGAQVALDSHDAKLGQIFQTELRRTFRFFGSRVRSQAKSFNIIERKDTVSDFTRATQDYVEREGAAKVVLVSSTTKRAIGKVISDGLEEGENRAQISKRIRGLGLPGAGTFGPKLRSAVIARTEVHSATSVAEDEMVKALGVEDQVKRKWLDAGDDRRRETHRTEFWTDDDRIKKLDEPFVVGGAILDYPGDPKGPPQEIIMCRCSLGYITPDPTPEKPRDMPGWESGKFRPSDFNKAYDNPLVDPQELLSTTMTPEQEEEMEDIIDLIDDMKERGLETHVLHRGRVGGYTRERSRLHKEIIRNFLNEETIAAATPAAGEAPVATFFGGRGGSGKGWLSRSVAKGGGEVIDKTKNIVMDADKIKEHLFAHDGVTARLAGLYHEESADIFDRIVAIARRKRINIVLDKTLKTTSSAIKDARSFAERGYTIDGFYMYLPRQEAGRRAILRTFGEQQRYVPVEIVLANTTNEQSFEELIPYFRRWRFYNNQVPKGTSPILEAGNF